MNDAFEQIHSNQVKALVKKLGNKALSDSDIKKEASILKLPKYISKIQFYQRVIVHIL